MDTFHTSVEGALVQEGDDPLEGNRTSGGEDGVGQG